MNRQVEDLPKAAAAENPATLSQAGAYPYGSSYRDDELSPVKWAWHFARRHFWLIATITVIGTALAAMYGMQRPTFYTATAEVVIDPTDTRAFGLEADTGTIGVDWRTVETQIRIARSQDVAYAVAERLGLEERMAQEIAAAEQNGTELNPVLAPFHRVLDLLPSGVLVATGLASEVVQLETVDRAYQARRAALGYLDGGLAVRQSGDSMVLSISFTAGHPAEAARVANAFADSYIEQQLAQKVGGTTRAASYLETRLVELEEQLREAEEGIKEYRAENRLIETAGRSLSEQELSQLSTELIQVRAEREDMEGRIRYIKSLRGGSTLESVGEILNSPLVAALLQEHIQLKRREVELLSTFGERHPQVLSLRADLQSIVSQIGAEADRYVASMENDLSLLNARADAIQQEMDRATQDNVRLSQAEVGLREREREAEAIRNLYNSFLARFTETREQRQVIEADARIIARAEAPRGPSSRGLEFFLAIGFVVSGAAGVGLAWLRETLDRGIRSGGELERQLGLPCLGQVPHLKAITGKGKQPHRYLVDKPRSAYAESIRSVGTYLRMSNIDDPPRVIQVTSAIPGEGKTTFAVSLATLLARSGQQTVLIDLDLHHPSVARELGLEVEHCLVDYMLGDATLEDVIHATDFDLAVLPVRRQTPDPSVLVSSQRLRQLLDTMRERFDYVVVDSPPLLLVTDPKTTSALVDASVLLVRWQETPVDKAANALRELDAVAARVAGAVLAQVDVKRQAQYGYAGVGSYYGDYKKYYVD